MALFSDDQNIGGQLKVGVGVVPAVGEGPAKVNGSMYCEGPAVFGGATEFITPYATVCIGVYANSDDSFQYHHSLELHQVFSCQEGTIVLILWQFRSDSITWCS